MIAIRDALAKKKVVVTAHIEPGESGTTRDQRSVIVTVGIADERLVIKTGKFGQLLELIDAAWSEYGEIVSAAETAVSTPAEEEPTDIGSAAPDDETTEDFYSDDYF